MLDRKIAPPVIDAVDFKMHLKPYEKYVLDNGVQVYAVNAGTQDVLQLELVYFAGNWQEEKMLTAAAVNKLLRNGTTKHNAFELNEQFEFYGGHIDLNCYNETATIKIHTLSRHLGHLLPTLSEMLTDSVFAEEEVNTYRQNRKQQLLVNLKKSDFVANRLIDEYVFGSNHPYGSSSTIEAYEALQRDDLIKFYNQYYRNGACAIFIAGKLPADTFALLNAHLGQLPLTAADPKTLKPIAQNPATEKKYRITNDPNGVQGAVRLARPFYTRHHPDMQPVLVLNNVFGGFFGSRLMSNIREDKGYTYGIHSYIQNHINNTAWLITTEAGRDVCEATVKEIYNEMQRLREEKIDDDEMELVRNYMMGSILADLDGPFNISSRWKNLMLNGLDDSYFYSSMELIRNVTPADLQTLAQRYLREEDFYELVVV